MSCHSDNSETSVGDRERRTLKVYSITGILLRIQCRIYSRIYLLADRPSNVGSVAVIGSLRNLNMKSKTVLKQCSHST